MSRLLEIKNINYILLLREIVVQLNKTHIQSDCEKPTVKELIFENCCELIQQQGSLSQSNTKSKVNVNYITKKIDCITQEIHPLFFNLLKDSKIIDDDGKYFIEFKNYNDMLHFEIFKSFKGVNASFYDVESKNIKHALKSYEQKKNIKQVSFDITKHKKLGLGPNSIILEDENGSVIFSDRIIIEIEDFFNYYGGDSLELKDYIDVADSILTKLEKNCVYKYGLAKNDKIFSILTQDIEDSLQSVYTKFAEITNSIGKVLSMSFEELENLEESIKDALTKHVKSRKSSKAEKEAKERAEIEMKQKEQAIRVSNQNKATSNAQKWKDSIVKAAIAEGISHSEIMEDFKDIVEDVAHRHPNSLNDKDLFIEAFLIEA